MSYPDLITQQVITTYCPSSESDEELAWRATQDAAAFQELHNRYQQPVYRYLLARVGDEQVAQDLTSQAFLSAYERITSYRFGGRVVGWLFRIATRALNDHLCQWNTPRNELARAINVLPADMAEALALRFFAGLNSSEIGLVIEKSDAAVKMLVYRGLCALEVQLSQNRG